MRAAASAPNFHAARAKVDDSLIIIGAASTDRVSRATAGMSPACLPSATCNAFGGDGAVEITLRAPIPIDTPMRLVREAAVMTMRDGDTLICEARAGKVDHLDPPRPPADWSAVMHQDAVGGCGEGSDFQWCLVCGRSRAVGDGLRVFGSHAGNGYVPLLLRAARQPCRWRRPRPAAVPLGRRSTVRAPGPLQDPEDLRPALTGRMTAKVLDAPRVGERCAVVGWRIGAEGRKLYSGTALYTESGRLCAIGHCTWIVLKE
jgi:hypothetical protein